jgi:hypothetical protein
MIAVYVDFLAASLQKNGDSELPAQLLSWLGAGAIPASGDLPSRYVYSRIAI